MPEGDTVLRTARRLETVFAGALLTRAELRWGSLDGTPLLGATTTEVVARGKHILHRFDAGLTLHSHLRMEGQWRITAVADAPPLGTRAASDTQVRAVLVTDAWAGVGNRLGMLDLVRTADEHLLVGHLGPDILGVDWNEEVAITNLASYPGSIAAGLLDQRNLAGIGTLYTCETLFIERIHPWTQACRMPPGDLRRVIVRAQGLMRANLGHAVQSTTGERRRGHEKYVHARSGRAHMRAVPTPACSSRTARFGLTPACPLSTLLRVTREIPSRSAVSETVSPSSASTSSRRISPGCAGFDITIAIVIVLL